MGQSSTKSDQNQSHTREPGHSVLAWVVATLIVLIILYVLSSGPALWLVNRSWLPREHLSRVYLPIHWGIGKSDWFRIFMWHYLELWDNSMPYRSVDPFAPPTRVDPVGF
jgi:hypothetical protein